MIYDRRSMRHKGCAYIELEKLKDVPYALKCDGKTPSFQRFPIKVEPSDAASTISAIGLERNANTAKAVGQGGFRVFIGNVVSGITENHIRNIFSHLGSVTSVQMQNTDWARGVGFAFCQFRMPEDAQLAIDGMEGCTIGSMEIKMSWAKLSEDVGTAGAKANGRPADAEDKIVKARAYAAKVVPDLPGSLAGR